MLKRTPGVLLICILAMLCLGLCGCDMQIDESMLTTQADYSINISLPYATVTPPPAHKEETQALVIDSEGSVTLNDSTLILNDNVAREDASSIYKSLRQGNTGLAVQALQTRLQELGYFQQGITGIFDAQTEAAVRRFEQTYGTMQTGVATSDLQERLYSADALVYASDAYNEAVISQYTILARGDVGSSVYALQQRLKNLGYPINSLTGIYDNETANAVMLFYEAYGLTASDVANVALQKEIYSDSARSYGGGSAATAASSLSVMAEENIVLIQQHLIRLGYLTGDANGVYDKRTEIAAKLFEEACGQLPSDSLSADLMSMLESENAPSFESFASKYANMLEGSVGDAVVSLQARLVELGFALGSPNGEYGSATTAALKLFQTANSLEANGVASIHTQAVLFSSFALNAQGETAISAIPQATPEPTQEPAAPAVTRLIPGSTGDAVLRLQNRLTELGYTTSVTGTYDGLTSRAIASVQEAIGCEATGETESELFAFILSSAAPTNGQHFYNEPQALTRLAPGDSGDEVTRLQKRLWELGYLEKDDIEDHVGEYEDVTQACVIALQTELGYESPDGIASTELLCYMYAEKEGVLE